MEVILFHNADAGDQGASRDDLLGWLRAAGYSPRYFPLQDALAPWAFKEAGEFIIVAGGDGSVRKIALELVHSGRPLALLPMGTANNIATGLGIAGTPQSIIAGWAKGVRKKIDVGLAVGPWGRRWFLEGIGIGLIGRAISVIESIDEASAREFSTREDRLHRDACVFAALAHELPSVEITLSEDGREFRDDFLLLEILNISHAGPGIELATTADPGDGFLDVVSVTVRDREKLTEKLKKRLAAREGGPVLDSRKIRQLRVSLKSGEVRLDDQVLIEREDTAKSGRPMKEPIAIDVSIEAGALEFLLPAAQTE